MISGETKIAAVATEIQDLAPTISELAQRARMVATSASIAKLEGRGRAELLLPCEIGAEALERCKILVTNNVVVLETLGVISLTRYVFELLVWLRTIKQTPLKSLYFLMLSLNDGEAHTAQHIEQLKAEASFFDMMAERDDPVPAMRALQEQHGENLTAEIVRAAEKSRMGAIDLEARRHFSVYAADAKINGYSFQAHLIRTKAIIAAEADLKAHWRARTELVDRFGQALINESGIGSKWIWANSAKAVGMEAEYEYIYRYTSRLLHATPTSFYTSAKNLELVEMRVFLEFVYVRLLDVIDVVAELIDRAETNLVAHPDPLSA
ncbi:hypothetical protein [Rhizobium sp. IY2]|uniref:hypothetical protein n=1 Tax=Rhizobium sp. IY2 TaxID=3397853 RepID=UPI0039DF3723